MEAGGKPGFVLAAEFADRIVVGMGVGAEGAHRNVFIGEGLDTTAGKGSGGGAINEQCPHSGRGILRRTGTALVGFCGSKIEGIDRVHDEMNHVILADPVPEIGKQEKWDIVIKVDEASCHGGIFTMQGQGPSSKSDRLLEPVSSSPVQNQNNGRAFPGRIST